MAGTDRHDDDGGPRDPAAGDGPGSRPAGGAPGPGYVAHGQVPEADETDEVADAEILDAMIAQPILIERPIVVTDAGVRLCRPPERLQEILPI